MISVFCLSLIAVSLAYSPQVQSAAPNRAQASAPQQRGTDSLPISVKLVNPGQTTAQAAQEAERINEERRLANQTLYANLTLVAATVLTLFVLAFQSYWLRRDVRQAELATRIDLRAYVRASIADFRGAKGHVKLENVGKTPAQVTRFLMTAYHGPRSGWKPEHAELPHSRIDLAPGATAFQPFELDELTPDDHAKIAAGDLAWIYLFGTIRYTDVFGSIWTTQYCYDAEGGKLGTAHRGMTLTQGYNTAT